jgi:hypothetical protein
MHLNSWRGREHETEICCDCECLDAESSPSSYICESSRASCLRKSQYHVLLAPITPYELTQTVHQFANRFVISELQ